MFLYRILDMLFPRSFPLKIFFVAFIGTHVPLISFVCYMALQSAANEAFFKILALLLLATIVGSAITIFMIWALLEPIRLARASFKAIESDEPFQSLPAKYQDELGYLMYTINKVARTIGNRLSVAKQKAQQDPLTGCLNRRGFLENVSCLPDGAIIYIDLDHFKKINDSFGHARGDEVLKQTADILLHNTRASDLVARFGGEEFVVWMPAPYEELSAVAERLRVAIESHHFHEVGKVTASFGVVSSSGGVALLSLLDQADAMLYKAKNGGRNRVVYAVANVIAGGKRDDVLSPLLDQAT